MHKTKNNVHNSCHVIFHCYYNQLKKLVFLVNGITRKIRWISNFSFLNRKTIITRVLHNFVSNALNFSKINFSLRCDFLFFFSKKKEAKNAAADMKIAKIWRTPLKEKNFPTYGAGQATLLCRTQTAFLF